MRNSTVRNLILSIALIAVLIAIAAVVIFRITGGGSSGKSSSASTNDAALIASPTQAPVEAIPDDDSEEVIEMEKEPEETDGFKNVIGEKSAVSSKVIITNATAFEITALYLRRSDGPKTDTAWGQELFRSKFTLKEKEQALYYYTEPNSGSGTGSRYDIRMILDFNGTQSTEEIEDVPFTGIKEIQLFLDVTGDYGVSYAECTGTDGKKYSTRSNTSADTEEKSEPSPTPAPQETAEPSPVPTEAEAQQQQEEEEQTDIVSDEASLAAQYIGQSFGNLESALGSPSGSDYEDEPDTGVTGYHYYSTFTVSTTVDENGNEIVSGIW